MIEINELSYKYPESSAPVLQQISLTIHDGEFVLLTGPSGSGKSTLLRALSGLVPHFSGGEIWGSLRVEGRDPVADGPQALGTTIGLVFQSPEAQAVLDTVESEIAFGLENAGVPEAEMRIRVEEVLSLLELAGLRSRSLHTLSGGERQRVAIGSALALRPRVLALDEPTSQLDPQAAADLLHALVRLNEDLGLTIILAEHRLERILRYAERVIALEGGRVIADGHVPEVLPDLPQLPPLQTLAKAIGWRPLPLTVKQARRFSRRVNVGPNGRNANPTRRETRLLTVENLDFGYRQGQQLLRDISFEMNAGEAIVLMGRNGSGKTSLLKCLVGLLVPWKGKILLEGQNVIGKSVAEICQTMAFLPQTPDDLLYAETVRAEFAATLENHGMRNGHATVDNMMRQLELADVADRYPRDLSVGQRQRVALGAVVVTRPNVLLLDEPTRGLDAAAKSKLAAMWRRWQESGMGLLLVTHDVELAAQVADRVMILGDGEIIADGPAREVLTASPLFASQIARLFPEQGWLTVDDALAALVPDIKQN